MMRQIAEPQKTEKPGRRIKNIVRGLLGILILFFLFSRIGFEKIAQSLLHMNLWAIPLAAALFAVFLGLSALASWVLLRAFSPLGFRAFLPCYLPSWAIGLFLPGKFGELSIVYFLKKRDVPIGKGTAFFVVGKTVTVFALGLVAVTGFFTFFPFHVGLELFGLLVLLLAGFLVLLLSSLGKSLLRKILPRGIRDKFAGFFTAFAAYFRTHKKLLGLSLGIRLLSFGCMAVLSYVIFAVGLNVHIGVFKILQVSTMETFSALIPISINGLGVRQALGIYLYGLLGITAPVVAGSQVVGWVLIYLYGLILFIWPRPS